MGTVIPRSGWFLAVALLAILAGSQAQTGVQQLNSLAFALFEELSEQAPSENVFFSPLSIATAYSLLHLGAGGNTRAQLESVFGFGTEGVLQAFLDPFSGLVFDDVQDDVEIVQSSQIYMQDGFNYTLPFKIRLTKNPLVDVPATVPFMTDPEASRKEINSFVNRSTMGYIEEILAEGSVDELTRMVVVSAVVFKGGWMEPFDKEQTTKMPFAGFGKNATVDMMTQRDTWLKISLSGSTIDAQVLELPYGNGAASMLIFLPNKPGRQAYMDVAKQLRGIEFASLIESLQATMVNVYLPKFEIEAMTDLADVLPALGVTDLFKPATANLSGISVGADLYVSSSVHKSRVKVDEEGTTAVAADAAVARATSLVLTTEFRADHPFIYFIVDSQSKAILFMGSVQELPMDPIT